MSEFTAAPAFKDAAHAAAVAMWAESEPDVQVAFGHPGPSQAPDIVSFGRVSSMQETATLSTNRSREEVLELEVTLSIFRGGGPEMEKVCSDRGYELLGQLERYLRVTDTTLGGVVRHSFLREHESDGATDVEILGQGRLIEIKGVIEARNRITTG